MRSKRDELAFGLLPDGVGHAGVGDLRPVLLGDRGFVLAELFANRVHLLAQEILALLLLRAGIDVVADALADAQLRQPVLLQLDGERQPLATSSVSSSSSFWSRFRSGE